MASRDVKSCTFFRSLRIHLQMHSKEAFHGILLKIEKKGKIKEKKDREGLNQLRWVEENIRNAIACPLFILGGLIKYWAIAAG